MQKLVTATGKEIPVLWLGPSTIDGALRFEVPAESADLTELFTTFSNVNETSLLRHFFDNHETIFRNYKQFKGVDLKPGGSVVVALNPVLEG